MHRSFGLAHLSALHLTPPALVDAAASAGFSSVGIRIHPATEGEEAYPMHLGSPMLSATLERLRATGVVVRDVEAFTLDGRRGGSEWMPTLEVGAVLGAAVLNVICTDPDPARLVDSLAALVEDAEDFGITPSVEPISYQVVSTVDAAAELSRQTRCGVMIDVLHFVRAKDALSALVSLPAGSVTGIQICDGPEVPERFPRPRRMPLGQSVSGSVLQLESRARRMPPGEGTFPLAAILAAFPRTYVSVEVPDVNGVEAHGVVGHLARLHSAAETLLTNSSHTEGAPA